MLLKTKEGEKAKLDDWANLLLRDRLQSSRILLYAIAAILVIFCIWASLADIDERVDTQSAVVIPISQVQEIQNLEGGILKSLDVHEGDTVQKGQVLAQLDVTQASAAFDEAQSKYYASLARQARLQAEATDSTTITFPDVIIKNAPDLVSNEQKLFNANRNELEDTTKTLQQSLQYLNQQIAIITPLVNEHIIPKIDLIKLEGERNDTQGRLSSITNDYHAKARDDLVKTNVEVDTLGSTLSGLKDRMTRTTVRSPVNGIVKKIDIDTEGGTIKPGEEIMTIVPIDEQLQIEGKVIPSKIAFLHPGQEANVRISAYDPTIYGSIKGTVVRVGADAIMERDAMGREQAYYKVVIQTDQNYVEYRGEQLPIIPGMQATVSILTGHKTIMSYLLKPILKAKQDALRER